MTLPSIQGSFWGAVHTYACLWNLWRSLEATAYVTAPRNKPHTDYSSSCHEVHHTTVQLTHSASCRAQPKACTRMPKILFSEVSSNLRVSRFVARQTRAALGQIDPIIMHLTRSPPLSASKTRANPSCTCLTTLRPRVRASQRAALSDAASSSMSGAQQQLADGLQQLQQMELPDSQQVC